MNSKPTQNDLLQRDRAAATPTSIPGLSRRTFLRAGTVAGSTLAISGCSRLGESLGGTENPADDEPDSTGGGETIRIPRLHLDSLEAEVAGETLQAISYEDWRSGSTTYVGQVSGRGSDDLFVGVSLLSDDAVQYEELVVYLCNGAIGSPRDIGIYLTGDYDAGGVTLTQRGVPAADEDAAVKLALVDGEFLGAVTLADGEQSPFLAAETTGDAGLYRAESDEGDLVVQWVVLPDGRQRGWYWSMSGEEDEPIQA